MKPIETTVALNNKWGYCYSPASFMRTTRLQQQIEQVKEQIKQIQL